MPEPLPRTRSGRALLRHADALVILVANCADDQSAQAQRQQQRPAPTQPTQTQPTQANRAGARETNCNRPAARSVTV